MDNISPDQFKTQQEYAHAVTARIQYPYLVDLAITAESLLRRERTLKTFNDFLGIDPAIEQACFVILDHATACGCIDEVGAAFADGKVWPWPEVAEMQARFTDGRVWQWPELFEMQALMNNKTHDSRGVPSVAGL